MSTFEFGVLGGIFASNNKSIDNKDDIKVDDIVLNTNVEYTPPDITDISQPIYQKQQRQTIVDTLIPLTIKQIIENIIDGNNKLRIYNTPIYGICIIGIVQNIEKSSSSIQFDLYDYTDKIKIHFTNNDLIIINNNDYLQVIGSLIILQIDNYYFDAQHIINFGIKSDKILQILKYHYINVAYTAYNLDVTYKLKLQNKHIGKINDLPGSLQLNKINEIILNDDYQHLTNEIEILIIKYLKSIPDGITKRNSIIQLLSSTYKENDIINAINNLELESEIACTKDHICLPI